MKRYTKIMHILKKHTIILSNVSLFWDFILGVLPLNCLQTFDLFLDDSTSSQKCKTRTKKVFPEFIITRKYWQLFSWIKTSKGKKSSTWYPDCTLQDTSCQNIPRKSHKIFWRRVNCFVYSDTLFTYSDEIWNSRISFQMEQVSLH